MNDDDPSKELAAPPPGTSTLRSLEPTPTGSMHVIWVVPLTLKLLQDFDVDRIFDTRETTVFDEEVPKLLPVMVIETPPDVGLPLACVTFIIEGEL